MKLTPKQRAEMDHALIALDEVMGMDIACTVVIHKIGEPWDAFFVTDGPSDELITTFEMFRRELSE